MVLFSLGISVAMSVAYRREGKGSASRGFRKGARNQGVQKSGRKFFMKGFLM